MLEFKVQKCTFLNEIAVVIISLCVCAKKVLFTVLKLQKNEVLKLQKIEVLKPQEIEAKKRLFHIS